MSNANETSGTESAAQDQGQGEGTALTSEGHESAPGTLSERLEAAVDKWYAGHHHRGVFHSTPILNADDLASLKDAVMSVASTSQE